MLDIVIGSTFTGLFFLILLLISTLVLLLFLLFCLIILFIGFLEHISDLLVVALSIHMVSEGIVPRLSTC